jgi:hypothetical protein
MQRRSPSCLRNQVTNSRLACSGDGTASTTEVFASVDAVRSDVDARGFFLGTRIVPLPFLHHAQVPVATGDRGRATSYVSRARTLLFWARTMVPMPFFALPPSTGHNGGGVARPQFGRGTDALLLGTDDHCDAFLHSSRCLGQHSPTRGCREPWNLPTPLAASGRRAVILRVAPVLP